MPRPDGWSPPVRGWAAATKLAAVLNVSAGRLEELLRVAPEYAAVEHDGEHEGVDAAEVVRADEEQRPSPAAPDVGLLRPARPTRPDRQADLATIQAMATAFQVADRKVGGGQIYSTVVHYLQTEISPRLFDPASDILGERLFEAAASLRVQ